MDIEESLWLARVISYDDRHAFRQLVLRYQSPVRLFLRRMTQNVALADDCAQETWITVYQKIKTYRGGSFRAWVLTIAFRKALRSATHEKKWQYDEEFLEQQPDTRWHDPQVALDFEKALLSLSIKERTCLHLHLNEELTHEEIAEVLQLPLGTVKSHVLRGKEKLKRLLKAPESGENYA